ncbi:MAG: hypothetical protein ACOYNC_12820 [Bacteroidales bacterium]
MTRSSREEDYLQFREEFPVFTFEKQEYVLTPAGLDIRYTFDLSGKHQFHPSLFIPRRSVFLPDDEIGDRLDNIVFSLGMIELISYWKAACSPTVVIKPFRLHPEQQAWWKKLYFNGLGEFFYLNSISATEENFMNLEVAPDIISAPMASLINLPHVQENKVIVPIGGGKDSAVTLELLSQNKVCTPLIINPRGASLQTIYAKGYSREQLIEIKRTIDPFLLQMNDRGFLNGHTPFSAMLAFVTVLSAIMTGSRNIALSNESSASEPTIEGTEINHQYSKSLQFETDFRTYVKKWISPDINYFSFLRPLNELQIAFLFARLPQYHPVFKSCNVGSKTDTWCGHCAKCLFTYTMLSPFLKEDQLVEIFGTNLFNDESLIPILEQLTGIAEEKPFDCVGTIREVNLALCETIRMKGHDSLPALPGYYMKSDAFNHYVGFDFQAELSSLSGDHHVSPEFMGILEGWMWTGGRADKRTGGRADKRTSGQADRRTGGQADGRTGGRV